jgi:hypothetical protein
MEEPNKRISELTMPELQTTLGTLYSVYFSIDLEDKRNAEKAKTLCRECFKYHGKLFVWKLRELFSYYSHGLLDGLENTEPEIHSIFIYKMKKAYFNNPDKVRRKWELEQQESEQMQEAMGQKKISGRKN